MSDMADTLFLLALIILAGTMLGEAFKKMKLPAVAGYIAAGIAFGPGGLNLIPEDSKFIFAVIAQIALGFIAFGVGTELFYKKLQKLGKDIFIISLIESLAPIIIVTIFLLPFLGLRVAFILGVFASSTSPAPISALMKQFRIKGSLIDMTLPITAIDDALGVIYFGVAMSIVGSQGASTIEMVYGPLREIFMSVLVGGAIGFVLGLCVNFFHTSKQDVQSTDTVFMALTVVAILLSVSLGEAVQGSPILLSLVSGAVFTNMVGKEIFDREAKIVTLFEMPYMIVFFALAGLEFTPQALNGVILVAIIYIIGRFIGKVFGSAIASKITKQEPKIVNNLGLALLPQGGIELGLAVIAATLLPEGEGMIVKSLVLIASIVFALLGTVFAKKAFENAQELSHRQ